MNSTTPGVRLCHKLTKYDVWLSPYVKMKCSMRKRPHIEWGRRTVLSRQKPEKQEEREAKQRSKEQEVHVCVREREGVRERGDRGSVW